MIGRFARIAWITMLVGVAACNPRKKLLDTANDAHAHHAIDRAFDALDDLVDTAPSSLEASQVPALAIRWGIEASEASVAEGRKRYLTRALALAPKSGELTARVCRLAADDGLEALRHCLDLDLLGKTDAPEAILAPLRARLATYDEAQERARLLASPRIDDWKLLQTKYPGSPEAEAALLNIHRAMALCDDLDVYLPPMRAAIVEMRDALKPPVTANTVVAFLDMRARAQARTDALEKSLASAASHRVMSNEGAIHDGLVDLLTTLVRANHVLHDELSHAVEANDVEHYTRAIVQFSRMMQKVSPKLDARVAAIAQACVAPAPRPIRSRHSSATPKE